MTTNAASATTDQVVHVNMKCQGQYRHEGNKTITYMPDALFLIYIASLLKMLPKKKTKNPDDTTGEVDKIPAHQLQQTPLSLIQDNGSMSVIYVFNMSFSIQEALLGCGYADHGHNKWLSLNSTSGSAGATINQSFNNPWWLMWTHHASDVALRGAMHDAFDLGVFLSGLSKGEFAEQQAKILMAIDPDTGNQMDITVDAYNKLNWHNQKNQGLSAQTDPNQLVLLSSLALSNLSLPPKYFVIPEILPAGTTILASEPKEGKSWLIMYLGFLIAAGRTILGRKTCPQRVLYMSLEDDQYTHDERQDVIIDQFDLTQGERKSVNFTYTAGKINSGFKEMVMKYLTSFPDTAFIAIDMLIHIRPEKEGNNPNKADHLVGRTLKDITDIYPNLAIMVSHHTNKGDKDTNIGMIAGTNALAGSFDNTYVLKKGKLYLKGRGLRAPYEIDLLKDNEGRYTMDAPSPPSISSNMNKTRKKVYEYIKANYDGNTEVERKDIIIDTGLPGPSVDQQLRNLVVDSLIKRPDHGKYTL